jgi:hypothetical protein
MAWMTGAQALAVLGVQPQTLYANVSRGRIRAKPDPKDSRRSLYNSEDVERLASRPAGRRPAASVAAAAIGWGDPVLASGVSTTENGRLWYRGRDAVALSESDGLEEVASLLWETGEILFGRGENAGTPAEAASSALEAALIVLSRRAGAAAPSLGRSRAELVAEAADLVDDLATAMLGPATASRGLLHQRLEGAGSRERSSTDAGVACRSRAQRVHLRSAGRGLHRSVVVGLPACRSGDFDRAPSWRRRHAVASARCGSSTAGGGQSRRRLAGAGASAASVRTPALSRRRPSRLRAISTFHAAPRLRRASRSRRGVDRGTTKYRFCDFGDGRCVRSAPRGAIRPLCHGAFRRMDRA